MNVTVIYRHHNFIKVKDCEGVCLLLRYAKPTAPILMTFGIEVTDIED